VSESPLFVGRTIAALAADPKVQDCGMLFGSWELERDYGLADYDDGHPDWGAAREGVQERVTPDTAKEPPTDYRASSRPHQGFSRSDSE
jgi:hypothetical protein